MASSRTAASAPIVGRQKFVSSHATEPVEAGAELRYDYEAGNSNYWQGHPPREGKSKWRRHRVAHPPPSGAEPTVDYLGALLAGKRPPTPERFGDL